jgi:heat-inducible transcriptional repressor
MMKDSKYSAGKTLGASRGDSLDPRKQRILKALVVEHIKSASPVGSKTLCRKYGLRASPATIRNEMAALEDMGYLVKAHASSGRIPTDSAFRFLVDHLPPESSLGSTEMEKIRSFYRTGSMSLEDILRETSRVLSQMSRHVGLILSPRFETATLQGLSISGLSRNRIMVVFEFASGVIEHRVIRNELHLRQGELERISNYLTESGYGKSLLELRAELLRQSQDDEKRCREIIRKAMSLSEQIMDQAPLLNLYIEGQTNLLEQPEFSDPEKPREFFRLCEEKKIMIRLLDQALAETGVKVIIGSENPLSLMRDYSLIASAYGEQDKVMGALGVIGPIRLDYGRIISLVKFTSALISDIIII